MEMNRSMRQTSRRDLWNNALLWLGVVCIGCAWTNWSGVYVSTYKLRAYEPWFGYALAAAGTSSLILSLRQMQLRISASYFWILIPLVLYGLLMPHPYSLGPWILVFGLGLFSCGRENAVVRSITPGILLSGLLLTVESLLVPIWYYLGGHGRSLSWLASILAGVFSFLGMACSVDGHTLFAKCAGDYRTIQVTADAIGLLAGLFILIGMALCWSLRGPDKPRKGWIKLVLLWVCYLLARYIVLLWTFLGWPDKTSISLMWDAVYCFLSFIPLVVILALSKDKVDLAGRLHLSWAGWSSNVFVWTLIVCAAIVAAVFGSSLTDPGHSKAGRVLIDEGHSEWEDTMRTFDTNWYGQASTYNYYCLRKFLENYYAVTVNLAGITPQVLENQDIVILKCPTRAYAEKELEALFSFVGNGGGLFLIGDHTDVFGTSTVLNPLAKRFDISFDKNGQWDIDGQFSVYNQPKTLGHPVGRHTPAFLFATGCTLRAPVWSEKPVIGYGMMTRLADYKNENFFPDLEAHPEDRPEDGFAHRARGPFHVVPIDVEDVRGADVRPDHAHDHSDPQVVDPRLASDGLA